MDERSRREGAGWSLSADSGNRHRDDQEAWQPGEDRAVLDLLPALGPGAHETSRRPILLYSQGRAADRRHFAGPDAPRSPWSRAGGHHRDIVADEPGPALPRRPAPPDSIWLRRRL